MVVNEASVSADMQLEWVTHASARAGNMAPKRAAAKTELLLKNVSDQTGLQFSGEMRTVDVWEVTR